MMIDPYKLRNAIAKAGLAQGIAEALERVQPGPDGKCVVCHESGGGRDYRYGVCDSCAFCSHDECINSPTLLGGPCVVHGGKPRTWRQLRDLVVHLVTGKTRVGL